METKKTKRADLENKRSMFLQIGLVVSLGLVLLAFEWGNRVKQAVSLGNGRPIADEKFELPPITRPEEVRKELPKAVVIEQIEILDNKSDEIEDVLEFISEATPDTKIDINTIITEEVEKEDPVFLVGQLDENPEFPGGMLGLQKFLFQSVKYPNIAQERGIQGTVFLTFIISKEGRVENVKIIRGVDPLLDKEALRVVNSLPTWKPGKQNGRPVKVSYQVPIKFQLNF